MARWTEEQLKEYRRKQDIAAIQKGYATTEAQLKMQKINFLEFPHPVTLVDHPKEFEKKVIEAVTDKFLNDGANLVFSGNPGDLKGSVNPKTVWGKGPKVSKLLEDYAKGPTTEHLATKPGNKKIKEGIKSLQPTEAVLHKQICGYIRLKYPNVMFHTDFAAGVKLTKAQAGRNKSLQSGKGWPDLFIAEPRGGYYGLFIELKKSRDEIFNKNGTLKTNEHLKRQIDMLIQLKKNGYKTAFGLGYNETVATIDDYFKKPLS